MKRSHEYQLEYESRLALRNLLPKAWIVRDKEPDVGIDMEIEIVEGEEVTNKMIWVQLKSTGNTDTKKDISYPMDTKHLKYYEGCQLPVIILYWIKSKNEFYYMFSQKYIQEIISRQNPKWREQKTVTIKFSPESKLDHIEKLNSVAIEGALYLTKQQLTGNVQYWLDGIPESNNEMLKDRTLKALLFLKNEKHHEAIEEFEKILRVCTVFSTERMSILLNLGNAYYSLSQINDAFKIYNAIIELADKLNEKDALEGKSAALGNIGLIYSAKGDLDNALKYLKDALKIHKEIGYKQGEASDLGNIGLIYSAKGDLDNALKYLKDAIKILDRFNLIYGRDIIQRAIKSIEKGTGDK